MLKSFLDCIEHICEQKVAADDESRATLACFTVDSDHRIFQEVILNELQLVVRERLTFEVTSQSVHNVRSLLLHALDE